MTVSVSYKILYSISNYGIFVFSSKMAGMVEKQLVAATQIIEKQLDAEIERLDNLDSDDLDAIRRDRLAAMKKRQEKKQEWIANVSIP